MKKKLITLAAACAAFVLCAALFAGCSGGGQQASEGSGDQGGAQTDAVEFVVGFDQDFPPFGYVGDDGEYTGFDLKLAAEVCERNGWTFSCEPINWDAKDSLLNQGSITCIWNGFTIEGREDGYAFTSPYLENGQVVVVRADSGITSLDDLAGKVVLVQADSAAEDLLVEGGDKADLAATFQSLETIAEYNTAMMQLEQGTVDAVALDLLVAEYQMGDKADLFVMLDEPLSSEHYGVGFKLDGEDSAELIAAVEKTLAEMYADGTVEELAAEFDIPMDAWLIK